VPPLIPNLNPSMPTSPGNLISANKTRVSHPELSGSQRTALEKRLQQARQASAGTRPASRHTIAPRADTGPAPLSHAQERLWFLDQLLTDRGIYNVYQAVRLTGPLDVSALARGLDELAARHDVFRTTFAPSEDGPVQAVTLPARLPLSQTDLSGLPAAARTEELGRRLRLEAARPFDLSSDQLVRATLIRLSGREHVLLFVMHHIVSDGWTMGLLFRELGALHAAFVAGQASPLPPLPIRYADFARWERDSLQGEALEKPLAYWRRQLAGATPLVLPTDHAVPATPAVRGATIVRELPPELLRELRTISQRENATLFMTLLAGFQALLHRYSGQDDLVVGSCVAGRPHVDLENLAGFFVNTLVLRTSAAGHPTFRELLKRARETVLGAMAHQDIPFEKIVAELQPDRSTSRNPFFQVMFVLQSAASFPPEAGGLGLESLVFDNGTAKFDLTYSLAEVPGGGLGISVEYRTDLFEPATVERMLGHYQTLLAAAAAEPMRRITELPLLPAAERQHLLEEWAGRTTAYARQASIVDVFARQVARTPDATAISGNAARLTYRELDEHSNRIAHHLRRFGAGPGTFVALCLERSPQLPVALLAILKTGAAYVSLDPAYPAARLGFMIDDARPVALLTQDHLQPLLAAALAAHPSAADRPTVVSLDGQRDAIASESAAFPGVAIAPTSTAYVCYTSGSTGKPKGVCVPHRGVVRLVNGTDYVDFGPDEVVLEFAPVAFDASTFEVWGPLLNGGRVAVFPPGLPSLAELGEFIRTQGVTTAFITTGLFHQLIDEQPEALAGLRQLITGGEVLSPPHAQRARQRLPHVKLFNAYGPTENTTFTTMHPMTSDPAPGSSVPIGRPIANSTVYVLDHLHQPVPIGVPGELYTGGDGLASGYLRRPDLDAERFLPNPFSSEPGSRLYRTGDLVRWLPDGSLEFLGRADRQVKLRGFRLELGEIESVLSQHPSVGRAAVLHDNPASGPRLVAYVAGRDDQQPDPVELRRYLQKQLPDYMVPAVLVPVPEIPLNANGKIDRAALPTPDAVPVAGRPPYVAPRNTTEARLVELWEKTLGTSPIGVHDSFFELGGHSLVGARLFARIDREFGRRLPLASLFECPTIAQLAERLSNPDKTITCSSLVALQPRGSRPPVFFLHGAGGGNLWTYTNLLPYLGSDQPVYGLESRGMRGMPEFTSIEEMATHYIAEIRTVQPQGPYYLAGYCFGGNVAYEIARQFQAAGERVAFVGLLDSAAANSGYQRLPWWQLDFHWRFAVNTAYWLSDFLDQPLREQARYLWRKTRVLTRRVLRWRSGRARVVEVEEVIDLSRFSDIELSLWKIHLQAYDQYHAKPYTGPVVLFRTRGHPFLCSFDPQFGWGPLVGDRIEIVRVPGAHERIFLDPHVRELGARFRAALDQAQKKFTT
jgi:amino acid adenylation domain-containing protein